MKLTVIQSEEYNNDSEVDYLRERRYSRDGYLNDCEEDDENPMMLSMGSRIKSHSQSHSKIQTMKMKKVQA